METDLNESFGDHSDTESGGLAGFGSPETGYSSDAAAEGTSRGGVDYESGPGTSLRERDLGKWLERKLGRNEELWNARGSTSLLTRELLESLPSVFLDLSHVAKLRLLLAIFHMNPRMVESWQDEVEAVIGLATKDTDDWVCTVGGLLSELTTTGHLALGSLAAAAASAAPIDQEGHFTKTLADLRKVLAKSSGIVALPAEAGLLGSAALEEAFGGPPPKSRHFQPTRRPKSAATRADLLQKAKDTAGNQAKLKASGSLSSVVPIRARNMARKMDNTAPLKGIPTTNPLKSSGGFRDTNFARPSPSPAHLKKAGGAKLITIEETPQALKKRRKEAEAEAKETRKKEKEEARVRAMEEKETRRLEAIVKEKERKAAAEREKAERLQRPPDKPEPPLVLPVAQPAPPAAIPNYAAAALASAGLPSEPQQQRFPPRQAPLPSYAPQPSVGLPSAGIPQPRPPTYYVPPTPHGFAPQTPSYVPLTQPMPQLPPQQASTSAAPPQAAAPQQRKYTISKEVMQEAQDMFRSANMLSRPEKALILGFMAGNMENPCPQMGSILTVRLSESRDPLPLDAGQMGEKLTETFFQMNYASGEWKRLQKVRHLVPSAAAMGPH